MARVGFETVAGLDNDGGGVRLGWWWGSERTERKREQDFFIPSRF